MNSSTLRQHWHDLPEKTIRHLQSEKLRLYLRNVVLPFSKHYREVFEQRGLRPQSLRTVEDLVQLPFTTKADLSAAAGQPQPTKDFLLIPDQQILSRRPSIVVRALLQGQRRVKEQLEREYRPIFMTSTTGRSADPVPFLNTSHDIDNLKIGGAYTNVAAIIPRYSLRIARAGGNVIIAWPTAASGFLLQSNTNLNTTNWMDVAQTPGIVGSEKVVTNSVSTGTTFFRLRN